MNFLTRIFLLFSFLLIGIYGYSSAYTSAENTIAAFRPAHPDRGNTERLKAIEVENEDDDKPVAFKKQPTPTHHFSSSYYELSLTIISGSFPKTFFTSTFLFFFHKYLLYQVFRI